MSTKNESSDADPSTVQEWLAAIVRAPSRWDVALALIPVALAFGVLLGGTPLPMWAGVTVGLGVACAATGYVVTVDTPN